MNDPLSRVLLKWADSNWAWTPLTRLRPAAHKRLSLLLPALHALSGLVWGEIGRAHV